MSKPGVFSEATIKSKMSVFAGDLQEWVDNGGQVVTNIQKKWYDRVM